MIEMVGALAQKVVGSSPAGPVIKEMKSRSGHEMKMIRADRKPNLSSCIERLSKKKMNGHSLRLIQEGYKLYLFPKRGGEERNQERRT